jgi:hypothetical protein
MHQSFLTIINKTLENVDYAGKVLGFYLLSLPAQNWEFILVLK